MRRLRCWLFGHNREAILFWSHCPRCGEPIPNKQKEWYRTRAGL